MKKSGFTLAEVLIVLVVLGVIAAMTVPALLQNTNQTVYITGLNKAYSTLNNAIQMASIDQGASPADESVLENDNGKALIDNVFVPTLKVSRKWESAFQTQDGFVYAFKKVGTSCGDIPQDPNQVKSGGEPKPCFIVTIDVNGLSKGPGDITESNEKDKIQDQFVMFVYRNGVAAGNTVAGKILRSQFTPDSNLTANPSAIEIGDTGDCSGCGSEITSSSSSS